MKKAFTLAEVLVTLGIIGVVAAMTIPLLITNIKKREIETRLKSSYSILSNAVRMSEADNDSVEGWDFSLDTLQFMQLYLLPYLKASYKDKNTTFRYPTFEIFLLNGTKIDFRVWNEWGGDYENKYPFVSMQVDINGNKRPNKQGVDIFYFYLFPYARNLYNNGIGDQAYNVPSGGLYYDGYGASKDKLINNYWRGCKNGVDAGYCTGLIVRNGWKIPPDYPIKL